MTDGKLIMTFEANTIKHLGIKMYSNMPPALAELIANSYDACATEVHIRLYDKDVKSVVVEDNGVGMSFQEVNNYFLRIGRNRREEAQASPCGRVPTGKKGLGKLALFGIGDTISIITSNGESAVNFKLDWNEINNWHGGDYEPQFDILDKSEVQRGTQITLTNLKRKTGFPLHEYAEGIAKLFNFQDQFVVNISLNDGDIIKIDAKSKYINIEQEFEWNIKSIIDSNERKYEDSNLISGVVVTTEKPLGASLRGITLFANGRLVNAPEFFGPSESSHFFSYATGWLNVDFIDNWEEDVISTNRQSIDWENSKTSALREYLASCVSIIERSWRDSRKNKKRKELGEKTKIDIANWLEKLPAQVQHSVEEIITLLDETPELSEEKQQKSIQIIHHLIPEYANLHWRNLEEEIKLVSEKYYQTGDYYTAFIEALKRYISEVRKKSGSMVQGERALIQAVFGGKKLSVTKKFKRTDGSDFTPDTIKNIEEGQHYLSEGIVVGGRHPLQHEEHIQLSLTGLFSEKDCLDFLSLLSHLFKRLNDSEAP